MTGLHQAQSFYTEIHGFPVLFEDTAQRIVIVGASGSMLELGEHSAPSAGHHSCAVFHLADRQALDTAVEALAAAGCRAYVGT